MINAFHPDIDSWLASRDSNWKLRWPQLIRFFNMNKSESKLGLYSRIKKRLGTISQTVDLSRQVGVLVVLCFVGIYGTFRILSPQNEAA